MRSEKEDIILKRDFTYEEWLNSLKKLEEREDEK